MNLSSKLKSMGWDIEVEAFTVVFDACVLYPASLRDILLELSVEGIFRARWTDKIHDEWISNLLKNREGTTTPETLARTRKLMDQAVPDCLVTGYEQIIESLELTDKDDRHVLAAAIVAKAGAIVTANLKDFPDAKLREFGIEAQHPDDFLIYQFDLAQAAVLGSVKRLRARLKNSRKSADEYFETLANLPLPQFTEKLRRFKDLI